MITKDSLNKEWNGFVWMNPPYGSQKNKLLWIQKFIDHGNGIALMPDRTSATWWQVLSENSDCYLFTYDKIKFELPDGSIAEQPGTGNTFFAIGDKAIKALLSAKKSGLGNIHKTYEP